MSVASAGPVREGRPPFPQVLQTEHLIHNQIPRAARVREVEDLGSLY